MDDLGTFSHVGIVVPDIAAAIDRYARQLGVVFKSPSIGAMPKTELYDADGSVSHDRIEVLYTYSVTGPPHLELLQMQDAGVWHEEGLHHVGRWVHDVAAEDRRLVADGLVPEMRLFNEDGSLFLTYFAPAERGGIRIEILDVSGREQHEEWLFGPEATAG
jgi:catechol 2,3-dioxygenase-like lactoylglutathione lyase family enzyme